ncbi:MAG: DnaB-like helicase C-terminal domain-containing protein [Mariprofundaceae bacterium]
MNVCISVDGLNHEISDQELASLIANMEDQPYNQPLFDLLAQHPDESVRVAVAMKKNLSDEVSGSLFFAGKISTMSDLMLENYKELEILFENYSEAQLVAELEWDKGERVETGFDDFDNMIGGLKKGSLTTIGGEKGCGLTALALNIASRNGMPDNKKSSQGSPMSVVIFSTDLPEKMLSMRLLSTRSGVPLNRLMKGDLTAQDWRSLASASGDLAESSMLIVLEPEMTAGAIRSACLKLQEERNNIGLVIIDKLNAMNSHLDSVRREQVFGDMGDTLNRLAAELGIPVLALVEIEQQSQYPSAADFGKFSKSLKQSADVILMLYRNAKFAELVTVKPREHASAKASLMFNQELLKFDGDHRHQRL